MNCCDANGKCKGGKGCPVGEPLPIDMLDAALAEQPAPMSQPNRLIAYSATSKLRELGYEWADDAWKQPAEQEPVAWWHRKSNTFTSGNLVSNFAEWTPLYTSPPQLQPLTDEEICTALGIDGSDDWTFTVAYAIIAAYERKKQNQRRQ